MIELIAVIVILGVLAAVALPRLADLSTEARVGLVNRARAEVAGAANLAAAKCLTAPGCAASGAGAAMAGPDGRISRMFNGYPTGLLRTGASGFFGIQEWVRVAGLTVVELNYWVTEFRVPSAPDPLNCLVRYTEASSLGASPTIVAVTTGC